MKRSISQIKEKIIPILKEAGVRKSAIFGSYARCESKNESDIDILVELPEGKSLLDLVRLEKQIEAALGIKVDLLTYASISPLLKDTILKEQLPIL